MKEEVCTEYDHYYVMSAVHPFLIQQTHDCLSRRHGRQLLLAAVPPAVMMIRQQQQLRDVHLPWLCSVGRGSSQSPQCI